VGFRNLSVNIKRAYKKNVNVEDDPQLLSTGEGLFPLMTLTLMWMKLLLLTSRKEEEDQHLIQLKVQ
jgi:hypothetical protein